MIQISDQDKKTIVAAVTAANRLRADLAAIEKAAALIARNPELRAACGFNEGNDLDEQLVGVSTTSMMKHAYDAPMHWVMRSGISPN